MFPSHIQKKNHADPSQISFYSCSDCRLGGIPYTQHPEWKNKEPFASLLRGDLKAALEGGDHGPMEHFMATHTGMTTDEFALMVKGWMATAKHPQTGKRFLDMTYQPMLCETARPCSCVCQR